MKILETDRLILWELSVDDAPFMFKLLNDSQYLEFIGDRGIRSLDDARQHILNGPMASYKHNGFGLYLIKLKETGDSVGICGLIKRDALEDIDIGYAFLPKFRGKGYAFEAASGIVAYAQTSLGINRVVAITTPDNYSSIKLLEKLGLRFEKMIKWPEDGSELKLFSIEFQGEGKNHHH